MLKVREMAHEQAGGPDANRDGKPSSDPTAARDWTCLLLCHDCPVPDSSPAAKGWSRPSGMSPSGRQFKNAVRSGDIGGGRSAPRCDLHDPASRKAPEPCAHSPSTWDTSSAFGTTSPRSRSSPEVPCDPHRSATPIRAVEGMGRIGRSAARSRTSATTAAFSTSSRLVQSGDMPNSVSGASSAATSSR